MIDYHQTEGISRSELFRLTKSPEYFKYCMDNPPEQTHDMLLGTAFHKLVLEPQDFDSEFAVYPACDRRTKAGKDMFAKFTNEAAGKSIISQDEYGQISAMRDSVLENEIAGVLLRGEIEKPCYWTDKRTGELCKCRPDVLTTAGKENIIVDLKSCRDADTDAFMREALKLGYSLQAAMYKEGLDITTGRKHSFVFIAVEKAPPYSVNILQADDFFIEHGQHLFRKYLDLYHECKTSGNWYGYNGKDGYINNLSVPNWLISKVG